jgi:DNA gyrase subunit A
MSTACRPRRPGPQERRGHRQERAGVNIGQVHEDEDLLVITEQGKILRTPANQIRTIGRATQGVRLMDLEGTDRVVSVVLVPKAEEEPSEPSDPSAPPATELPPTDTPMTPDPADEA